MLDFFTGIFTSNYFFGTWLNLFTLLTFGALGSCVSLKANFFNLSGEGVIYLSGFVCAISLNYFSFLPSIVNLVISFLLCVSSGVLFSLLFCVINDLKKISILLVSYIFSCAIIPFIDSLITGAFRDQNANLLATPLIEKNVRLLNLLPPSPLNISIVFLPIAVFTIYFLFNKTKYGLKLNLFGKGCEYAKYAGLSYRKIMYSSICIDSVFKSIVAFVSITGQYYTCHLGFYSGLGWNSLTCALLARLNPVYVIFSSLFLSYLLTSASRFSLLNNLQADFSGIITGVFVFIVAGSAFFSNLFSKFKNRERTKTRENLKPSEAVETKKIAETTETKKIKEAKE